MGQRDGLINAVFAFLFGAISTTLALILLLIYVGLPVASSPEDLTVLLLGLVALGGVVVGAPVFVLCQRTALGR